jgi:Repeat of unknown function (DUF5648)
MAVIVRPLTLSLMMTALACHSDGGDAVGEDTGGSEAGSDPTADSSAGPDATGTSEPGDSEGGSSSTGDGPIDTDLPPLPELTNVRLRMVGDAANIAFDPWDPALDYRIYPLPDDDAIDIRDDGSIVVADAIYRCAGDREGLYMLEDIVSPDDGWNDNAAGGVTILHHDVEGFVRADDDAQLGWVFTTEADDRLPVYVLADPDPAGEGGPGCGRAVFQGSRPKRYTTDDAEREQLIGQGWRDDGIAFWVPATASAATLPVSEGVFGDADTLRWVEGPEGTMRGAGTTIFEALRETQDGTVPLMRVHVSPYCSRSHDELVGGMARFAKVRSEGDQPITELRWSGITAQTVLVVEALDHGCPYQGNLSPEHQDAFSEMFGDYTLDYEAYSTLADMRAASPTGEVFVNGQSDEQVLPKALARSFVHADPVLPTMDFFATFQEGEEFRASFAEPVGNEYAQHFDAELYQVSSYANSNVHFGTMLGELWFAYNDIAADVNGKVRLTPLQRAEIGADDFLHVTTEIDVISTDRRYPQIIISDQDVPVQDNLPMGTTIIVQPKGLSPTHLQVQICDHRTWDVNDQCPQLPIFVEGALAPVELPGEHSGTDNAIGIDVYLSSSRIYMLLDGAPYACVDLPATSFEDGAIYAPPSGSVSVTWGDVLYHSGVDFSSGGGAITGNSYLFHRTHMQTVTRRHFDNLGFSSGVAAPEWDETRYPCAGGGA